MTSILKATAKDYETIARISRLAVEDAHRDSCSAEDMNSFLESNYNDGIILEELQNEANIYHIIYFSGKPAGFSKIVLNAHHLNVRSKNVTKLDRIYLLRDFYDRKLGYQLLNFNIELSKSNAQSGMWLFSWVGNKRAIDFYVRSKFEIIGSHRFKVTDAHYNEHHQMFLDFSKT